MYVWMYMFGMKIQCDLMYLPLAQQDQGEASNVVHWIYQYEFAQWLDQRLSVQYLQLSFGISKKTTILFIINQARFIKM